MYKVNQYYGARRSFEGYDCGPRSNIKNMAESGQKPGKFVFLSISEGNLLAKLVGALTGIPGSRIVRLIDKKLSEAQSGVLRDMDPWRGVFYREGLKTLAGKLRSRSQKEMEALVKNPDDDFLRRFVAAVLRDSAANRCFN